MTDTDHDMSERDAKILDVVKEEGRVNPYLVRQRTGIPKRHVNTSLTSLREDELINRVTRGLYEFVSDPREES